MYIFKRKTRRGLCAAVLICVLAAAMPGCGTKKQYVLTREEPLSSEEVLSSGEASSEEILPGNDGSGEDDPAADESQAEAAVIYVFVTGAVRNPGVYAFPEGARVFEAVGAAGGLTEEADESYVNQAAFLADGMQLYFPTKEETAEADRFFPGNGAGAENTGIYPGGDVGAGNAGTSADARININTADEAELQKLPGIGAAKAAAIVEYRTAHGPFARTEEIMEVSGIGEAVYSNIKGKITVE